MRALELGRATGPELKGDPKGNLGTRGAVPATMRWGRWRVETAGGRRWRISSQIDTPAANKVGELNPVPLLICWRAGGFSLAVSGADAAATAHASMEEEGNDGKDGGDPHEGKHADTVLDANVKLVLGGHGDLEGNADDGGNDGSHGKKQSRDEAENGQSETVPGVEEDEGSEEKEDEVEDGAGEEEAEHDARANPKQPQDVDHLCREGDLCA